MNSKIAHQNSTPKALLHKVCNIKFNSNSTIFITDYYNPRLPQHISDRRASNHYQLYPASYLVKIHIPQGVQLTLHSVNQTHF